MFVSPWRPRAAGAFIQCPALPFPAPCCLLCTPKTAAADPPGAPGNSGVRELTLPILQCRACITAEQTIAGGFLQGQPSTVRKLKGVCLQPLCSGSSVCKTCVLSCLPTLVLKEGLGNTFPLAIMSTLISKQAWCPKLEFSP